MRINKGVYMHKNRIGFDVGQKAEPELPPKYSFHYTVYWSWLDVVVICLLMAFIGLSMGY